MFSIEKISNIWPIINLYSLILFLWIYIIIHIHRNIIQDTMPNKIQRQINIYNNNNKQPNHNQKFMNISCILFSLNLINLSDIRVHRDKLPNIKYHHNKKIRTVFMISMINHHHNISHFTAVCMKVNTSRAAKILIKNLFNEKVFLYNRYKTGIAAEINAHIIIFRFDQDLNISK